MSKIKHEFFNHRIYQSPGGKVIFEIPDLDSKWKKYHFAKGDWRYIHCTAGEENQIWGRIIITIPPKYIFKDKVTSENVCASILKEIQKANPVYNQVTKAQEAKAAGGNASFQAIMGINKQNVKVISAVIGIIDKDSTYAMWLVIESPENIFENIGKVAEQILKTLYIGKHIPILPDRKPSKSLDGVYHAVNDDYFIIFDRRGYNHTNIPSPLYLDFDAVNIFKKDEIYTYDIKGNKIILTKINNSGEIKEYSIDIKKNNISLFGREYKRIDINGPKDDERIEASYENFYFDSSDGYYSNYNYSETNNLTLTKKGIIAMESSVSSNFTSFKDPFQMANDQMLGDFTTMNGGNSAYARDKDEGYYKIINNYLTIIYSNGEIEIKTIYYRSENDATLYVNGSVYYLVV